MNAPKYYHAYEGRYRAVYARGIEYWSGDPADVARIVALVDGFLGYQGLNGDGRSVVEFGCGEGYLCDHLLARGFSYLGIDIAESALVKARRRTGRADCFINGDVTSLPEIPPASFDVAIDNFTLHMLLTDADRHGYLTEVARLLRPGGSAFFHVIHQEDAVSEPVVSAEEYRARFFPDAGPPVERAVYDRGEMKAVRLPRLPFRGNTCRGYSDELAAVGLAVSRAIPLDAICVLYAGKGDVTPAGESDDDGVA
jgi:SAM-dependent methyltransferase